ncbi:uncharacterized protein LOC124680581 isoform X2 [Lolium rigidum]|uniref:uncharacterized protein LOC124680581 isoform X2 n=1 Tax=Lolium rigidum TaxID=89674 RepID=UPI001F5DDED5|nr:uncharacterized protein LOC124680581 isoform X2 [Lolium rigidum]
MLDMPADLAREREEETACDRIFREFMAGVARFEELVDGGRRFLTRFRQELEYFRRPRVPVESDVIGEIVRSNCTDRMKSYLESGCSLHCQSISNLSQLNSCEGELKGCIHKVKALLEELQCLVEGAYDATLTANLRAMHAPDESTADNKMNDPSNCREKGEQPADHLDSDSSLVTLMILVHNMLKLDYTMQEKIVGSLSLKSSSAELDGYCLMWDLRPYVEGGVMNLAWKSCP